MKKLISLYCITILFLITAIYGTISKKDGENIDTQEIVLLNPKYAQLVDRITIRSDDTLTINSYLNGAIGTFNNLDFPVNTTKLNEFILLASSKIKAQVFNEPSKISSLSTFVDSFTVQFSSFSDNKLYSDVIFGNVDFSGIQRYVKSTKNDTVFLIHDDYYSFMQTNPRAWLDSKLIPDYLLEGEIISISITHDEFTTEYLRDDSLFKKVLDDVRSLQSSNIVSPLENFGLPLHTITMQFRNKSEEIIEIFKKGETYIVIPQNNQLNYGLEISQWTYENLIKSFQI